MSAGRICVREVDLADVDESVQVAAERMHARNVGTLVVRGEGDEPMGIVTDRDLAIRVVGQGLDPTQTTVGEIMSGGLVSVSEDTPIEGVLTRMRSGPYRRLPVVDDSGKLVGLISIDDILDLLAEEMNDIGALIGRESPGSLAEP